MCKRILMMLFLIITLSFQTIHAADIVWAGFVNTTANADQKWIDLLMAQGHTVTTQGTWQEITDADVANINSADLVIVSANIGTSTNLNGAAEVAKWNSIQKPMLMMHGFMLRSNYWGWMNTTASTMRVAYSTIEADVPTHPVFNGITLDASKQTTLFVSTTNNVFVANGLDVGNGTLIAHTTGTTQYVAIAYWEAGVAFYSGSTIIPPAPRMFFAQAYYAEYNINANGEISFINAVNFLLGGSQKGPATKPNPGNGETGVSIDTALSWTSGPYANTHDVFFGTDFNDVNESTVAAPLGETIVSAGQVADANTFDPGRLDYGTTYYWRVDEANQPPDTTVYKGKIWSFTTESEGVELAIKNVLGVEAFAPQGYIYEDQEPNTTYNGIGVDANGMHSNDAKTMWAGVGDYPGDVWIQYELDQIYKLYQLKIWNYNEIEPGTPFGPKDVNITYSVDNITWKALDEIQVFPKAPGESTYKADIFVDMNGAIAKYVRLTFLSSYTDDLYTGGISEIRFLVIPTRATVPSPADKAVNVDLDSIISWKAGRNVGVHKVYISYDKASVDNRDIGVMSETIDPNYPITLGLGKTYYWRVDEVNDAEEYTTWDGPVWQFSTQQYVVVDNFDSGYGNDTSTNAVFLTWKDAGELGNTSVNGSWMGRKSEPYLQTINHSSRYSAPMEYDNALVSYSEVKAETSMLDIGSDWSKGNPTALEIWFRADANDVNEPVTDKLYASLSGGSRIYFDGDPSAIRKTIWTKFEVPLTGVSLTNVTSVTIGVEKIGSTGGKGVIYLDDIRLGVAVPASDPGTENLIARYEMENNVNDTSASGFNGTAFGIENGGLTYEAGKYGNALVFDGNNDYVELPIGETIGTLTSCTISTWVNYGGGAVWQKVYDFGSDTNKYMDLSANNNASAVRCSITTTSYQNEDGCNSPSVLSIGNWEHIVVVIDKDNATMKLYRNGDLSASDDAVTIFPENLGVTTSNWLGRSVWSDNPYFKGKIDDFRIYDRALSAGEVKYLYKN